jgi:hypothetical protein
MGTVQLETRRIVVEFGIRPAVGFMASGAICFAVFLELTSVMVMVAVVAIPGKTGEFLNADAVRILGIMASATGNFCMLAVQFERRPVVVELGDAPPIGLDMAFVAHALGMEFIGDKSLMFFLVAIHTLLADVAEMPLTGLLVAGRASGGFVGTFQFELRGIVPFQRVGRNLEPVVVVAFRAIRRLAVHGEFTLMNHILVAIRTPFVLQRLGHVARLVAFPATHQFVLAQQGKIGQIVIECSTLAYVLERAFLVAFLAVLTEFVVVDILVACVAVGILQIAESLPGFSTDDFLPVALLAGKRCMFTQQGEMRLAVVEGLWILKRIETVAFRTIGRHLALVVIVVAGEASLVQTEKSRFFLFQPGIGDVLGIVAFRTIQRGMNAFLLKSGFPVVERLFVEIDQPERTPVMLIVARRAVLAHHFGGTVVALMDSLIVLDFRMTGLTVFVGDLVAHGMAFGTIAHAFQIGMRIAQVARRNLGGKFRETK